MRGIAAFFAALALSLAGACQSHGPAPPPREQHPVAPGEEPLETTTLGDEEVVPLKPDPRAATPPPGRPCAWASVWSDPDAAHPLLAGVGGAPQPEKVDDAPVSIPVGDGSPVGEIVVEIVIAPDGKVAEASSCMPPSHGDRKRNRRY